MKTKTVLLICLLGSFGIIRLSAQVFPPVVEGTKSVAFNMEWDWIGGWFTPVYCPNEQGELIIADEISGSVSAHAVWHFVNGNMVWYNVITRGEVEGKSGEKFTLSEQDRGKFSAEGIDLGATWHFNLKGDQGNHYLGSITWLGEVDPNFDNLIINKAVCVEKRKK
jgi:hypothetical protein